MKTINQIKKDRYTRLIVLFALIVIVAIATIKTKNQKVFAFTLLGGGILFIIKSWRKGLQNAAQQ